MPLGHIVGPFGQPVLQAPADTVQPAGQAATATVTRHCLTQWRHCLTQLGSGSVLVD